MRFPSAARKVFFVAAVAGLTVSVVPTLTSASPSHAAATAGKPSVVTCLGRTVSKPVDDVVDCAKDTVAWRGVTWTTWGIHRAKGHGTAVINNCIPNCAGSHSKRFPAKVTLSHVVNDPGYGEVFSYAVVHYDLGAATRNAAGNLLNGRHQQKPTLKGGEFYSPLAGIGCEVDFTKGTSTTKVAYCQRVDPSTKHNASIRMTPKGSLTRCTGTNCVGDAGENTPTLKYGQVDAIGPYRCLSSRAGVICTVRSGVGFSIAHNSLARIKGY